jgi:uncharacterized paraquat-inducible protein A
LNNPCTGLCIGFHTNDYYDTRKTDRNSFLLGYKRCKECEYYIKDPTIHCPCCHNKLAIRPKNNKRKRILMDKQGIKRY